MTMTYDRPSAEIYQFPARGRFAAAGRHDGDTAVAAPARSLRVASASVNWYHEEAIREAERARRS